MEIVNPGNVVPFYKNPRWQRRRQTGQDRIPFGILAPNSRLTSFQLYVEAGSPTGLSFILVNAGNEADTILQSAGLLEVSERSDTGFWVTWKADQNLTTIPPCGFWEVKIAAGGNEYWSETFHLKSVSSFDTVGLELEGGSCDFNAGTLTFGVLAVDQLSSALTSQVIEYYDNSQWNEVGTGSGLITFQDPPPISIRRVVVTASGQTLTSTYSAAWDDGDKCGTLSLVPTGTANSGGTVAVERWYLEFWNETDKGTVLYQTGYKQQFYIQAVFNVSAIDREKEARINGFGEEISRYTRTVERLRWDTPDIPDYALHPLSIIGDVTNVVMKNTLSSASFPVVNLEAVFRQQGPALSTAEFSCDRSIEVFSGCQPNFELAE